jgi:hypothetical protein
MLSARRLSHDQARDGAAIALGLAAAVADSIA